MTSAFYPGCGNGAEYGLEGVTSAVTRVNLKRLPIQFVVLEVSFGFLN